MRAVLLSLSLLVVVAIGAASAQGYYDRVYRGASPDPTDNRYDAGRSWTGAPMPSARPELAAKLMRMSQSSIPAADPARTTRSATAGARRVQATGAA